MPFAYQRTIHFSDTDAAGVVYFGNYYAICHEAYEEALAAEGLELSRFFSNTGTVVPVVGSQARYRRPLACGDKIRILVKPERISPDSFSIRYEITRLETPEKLVAEVKTEHVCISSTSRERQSLPAQLSAWVDRG